MGFDVAAEVAKAMATQLRSTRRAGGSRPLGDDELARRYPDEPLSDDVLARADWEDAHDERLYDDDRTLTGEVPPGYDHRLFGLGEW